VTEVTSEIRAKMAHVRAAKVCGPGVKMFFDRHGLDLRDFLRNGIPVSKLEEIGDPVALRVAAVALEESRNG
jgi:hypothetical protein